LTINKDKCETKLWFLITVNIQLFWTFGTFLHSQVVYASLVVGTLFYWHFLLWNSRFLCRLTAFIKLL
jgi:hypothetical protein